MKNLIITSLVLAGLLPASAVAGSSSAESRVVSTSVVEPHLQSTASAPLQSVGDWQGALSHELADGLKFPHLMGPRGAESDFVVVRFTCGEDGMPSNVTVLRKSRDSRFNREAARAVSALKGLHPLPAGLATGRTLQANVVFATNESDMARQVARLRQSERIRMAAVGTDPDTVIALNPVARTPG